MVRQPNGVRIGTYSLGQVLLSVFCVLVHNLHKHNPIGSTTADLCVSLSFVWAMMFSTVPFMPQIKNGAFFE